MTRLVQAVILVLSILLTGCAVAPEPENRPGAPECETAPAKDGKDGGIGGTGIRSGDASPEKARPRPDCPN